MPPRFAQAAGGLGSLAAVLVLALVASWGKSETALYQRWHTLRPDGVLRADADYGTEPGYGRGEKEVCEFLVSSL